MRNLLISGIFIGTLFLAGCGSDQYSIEKEYYKGQKLAEKVFVNPHGSPPRELQRIVKILNSFVAKNPKSNLGVETEFTIARLYIVKEEFEKARSQLIALMNKYPKSATIGSEATFLIGNSYEIEDKWGLALQQYKKIMQEYPVTLRGINIPIYIAQHYRIKFQPDKMVAAFQEAISHYKSLAAKYPNTPLALKTDTLVAQCYLALKDWQSAINTFNSLIEKYKAKLNTDWMMMEIAAIYKKELKDDAKAKETLEKLVKNYPSSRLKQGAAALLKELNKK